MTQVFEDDPVQVADVTEIADDLGVMLRRFERVRALTDEHGRIELSPYMRSLLKMAGRVALADVEGAREAAGL